MAFFSISLVWALLLSIPPVPARSAVDSLRMGSDTTMRPGWQDFTNYRTPGECLQAASARGNVATRAQFDTLPYAPDHATLPSVMIATARVCGSKFTAGTVPPNELLNFMQLALILGDDAQAAQAGERYVASFQNGVQRQWALYALDTVYMGATPIRLAAAQAVTAQLDSLGTAAALQRGMAHDLLLNYAKRRYDIPLMRTEAIATLSTAPFLSATDQNDRQARRSFNPGFDLFAVELLASSTDPKTAIAKTFEVAQRTGYHIDMAQIQQIMHQFKIDWMLDQFGKTAPPLHADFWSGPDSGRRVWPIPGKVSIYFTGGPVQNAPGWWTPTKTARWQRLLRKYGDRINVTVMCPTVGYFNDSPPLNGIEEATRLAQYFHTELNLPFTVAVDTVALQHLPDGRVVRGAAAFEQSDYYQIDPFIITDASGKVIYMLVGPPEPEQALEAWIDRALGH